MARARVRFTTSGASKVTGAFGKVGSAAGGAQAKIGKFGSGIGGAFYKVMSAVGRVTMFTAGIQKMGKSTQGTGKDVKAFADGSVTALSAVSKKFAELRRQYYFFKLMGKKLASPLAGALGSKAGGASTKTTTKTGAAELKRKEILFRKFSTDATPPPKNIKQTTTAWSRFFAVLSKGGGKIADIATKVLSLSNVVKVLLGSLVAVSVAGGAAFIYLGYKTAQFAKRMVVDFLSIREAFRSYEVSLGGIIKNTFALGKMMRFATKYAAEYPAMFEEVLDTFRTLAALPALKPMFRRADEQDLKGIMDIIQGLATLDPIQGVKGAGVALREALSGDMRSIRRRFEISAHAIADAGGYALEEITQDSEKALKAFKAFIALNVPAKSMADAAMNIATQTGNLRDQYRTFVNDMMKSTGAYWSVVTALSDLNDWLRKVFDSPIVKKWAQAAGKHMRAFVETIKSVMSDVDWKKYMDAGDLVGGISEAIQRVTVLLRVMIDKWSEPFRKFVTEAFNILYPGIMFVVKETIKGIGNLFLQGMIEAGKSAATGLVTSFTRGLLYSLGWISGALIGKSKEFGSDISKAYDNIFVGKKVSFGSGKNVLAAVDKYYAGIKATYDKHFGKISPEIVTPEIAVDEQERHVKGLRRHLGAMQELGKTEKEQLGVKQALAKAEESLRRGKALKKWESGQGKDRQKALEQMEKYKKEALEAAKVGEVPSKDFYKKVEAQKEILEAYRKQRNELVEQKTAQKELAAMVKAAPGNLGKWMEQYKIGKKDAGALLLVVTQLNDIISGKITVTRDVYLDLLKKKIQLTDELKKKQIDYQKKLAEMPKNIAKSLANLAGGLQSSILSFAGKLQGAFIGIGAYGGDEPEPEFKSNIIGIKQKRKTLQERREETRQEALKSSITGGKWDFRQVVMEKIGDMIMVPKDMLGLGRKGMTYQEGLGAGQGKSIPPYVSYILQGIQKAMGKEKGPGEFAAGRKALAGMKMALLEKAIPFTKYRSEERAGLYAKMAGAQTDLMKATMETVRSDIKMQRDQLTELKKIAMNTKSGLGKMDAVEQATKDISINVEVPKTQQSQIAQPAQTGNNKITKTNPKTVTIEQGGMSWEIADYAYN